MANLNTLFLGVLVLLLATLSVFSGMESRKTPPTYTGQGYFAILFAAGAIGLVLYKMRTP
jgi:hypothetical protein